MVELFAPESARKRARHSEQLTDRSRRKAAFNPRSSSGKTAEPQLSTQAVKILFVGRLNDMPNGLSHSWIGKRLIPVKQRTL